MRRATRAGFVLAALWLVPFTVGEAQLKVAGPLGKFAFKTVSSRVTTNGTRFVRLPQATVSFTQGSTGPVSVLLCADLSHLSVAEEALLRVRVAKSVSPARTAAAPGGCFTFAFEEVPAGSQTVRVVWRAAAGYPVIAGRRTLTVFHN